MSKRIVVILFIIGVFLVSSPAAYADLIIEPENTFYEQHRNQCVYLGRSFCANGTSDCVSIKKEPGSNDEIATIKNDEIIYVDYSCFFKGDFWGITSFANPDKSSGEWRLCGWVKMDQLLVLYDYVAFEEDHPGELYTYTGDYEKIKETEAMIAWAWPGSGIALWTIQDVDTEHFYVSHAYMDEEGREWGFVTYFYGSRDIWVCLSDPLNRDIPVFNPDPGPGPWESETVHTEITDTDIMSENGFPLPVLIMILVALVVIGTAVLVRIFYKRADNSE